MEFEREKKIFNKFIKSKNLRCSDQRIKVLEVFLIINKHISVDELYKMIKSKYPNIGMATVYRTMKLLVECGLSGETRLNDGVRYGPLFRNDHHDHLICVRCGRFDEIINIEIENLQKRIAKEKGYILENHELILYGICSECQKKK